MSAQFAISHHLLTVNDYHRMAEAGESIVPLLADAVSVDWSGLFSY